VLALAGLYPDLTVGTFPSTVGIVRQNSTAMAYSVSPATHLWAATRFAMATTQPVLLGVNLDLSIGNVLVTTSPTALAVGDTKTGTLLTQAIAATAQAPLLRVVVKS
jgi:hypothetical protein